MGDALLDYDISNPAPTPDPHPNGMEAWAQLLGARTPEELDELQEAFGQAA